MDFQKLRLLGFKSFVEPIELVIERGLTGVVGPNGCGKSNLVEALRWVMGENSYKNMRASAMDDVIFSGSGSRPARNTAEVTLFLDNFDRTAPATFNDVDELQVSRRIEREAGSVYRINGKDVRAKDVQLLFADASTGARSPSMIGQGRIGELISAKPQARRALLEEAAGISGLHSRRHEAELRLRAAETNLERLDDVISQFDSQLESLKRQARQANRYRNVSADIRRTEATLFYLKWKAATAATQEAESLLAAATLSVGQKGEAQASAAKEQAIIAHRLPELRDAEAKAAAALQRVMLARNQIDQEAERISSRQKELDHRLAQLDEDISREQQMLIENSDILAHLEAEEKLLAAETGNSDEKELEAKITLEATKAHLEDGESRLESLTSETASLTASKNQLQRTINDSEERRDRLSGQIESVANDLQKISGEISRTAGMDEKQKYIEQQESSLADAEIQLAEAEQKTTSARQMEEAARAPLSAARAELNEIETEARTLSSVLNAGSTDLFPAIVDKISVSKGYEAALGAALGEDLDVSIDSAAPIHWGLIDMGIEDVPIPDSIELLSTHVSAPTEMQRRLAQIGIVAKADGAKLQQSLKPGQRLVSVEGDLWRWDGFCASAEAPTPAAQRLAQKNRLAELDQAAIEATRCLRQAEAASENAKEALARDVEAERKLRDLTRELQGKLGTARDELVKAERAVSELSNRRSALEEARVRLQSSLEEAVGVHGEATTSLAVIPDICALEEKLANLRLEVSTKRAEFAEAKAVFDGLAREKNLRGQRLEAIDKERKSWIGRASNAERQVTILRERQGEASRERKELDETPGKLDERRRALNLQISAAESLRKDAADLLAVTETDLAKADHLAKQSLVALSESREASARAEERLGAARERRSEIENRIREELECEPHKVSEQAELDENKALPEIDVVERKLEKYKAERERLGAVNLRADIEQTEIAEQRDALMSESEDLIEAIRRLRQGIQSLNSEGRERLLSAFDAVNDQFQRLFTHLFGGGTAELQLVESDDPLDAGLEILARPPGKKPQTMTLLSGGEQALTALALIFAVFLTNPAPICVLDEVDAPLDDHNVERFCDLMDEMSASTQTRFMIITHNPITMARMNRLFGVTMAERGVSQLVSVDLETAEAYRESG